MNARMHRWVWRCSAAAVLGAGAGLSAPGLADTPQPPLQAIARLDVPRYLGTWYEIAKYPNRFQRQCARDTQAIYTAAPEGRLTVTNQCTTEEGTRTEAIGEARQVGASDSPRLQVRFAPRWLSFLPQVWGNYWVVDLDPGYTLVAVSEPQREYLWILARSPSVAPAQYQALLARLQAQGFDLSRLVVSPHSPH